jgi:hypothetical protein
MTKKAMPSMRIRLASPDDASAIERFYVSNEHAFVAFRPEMLPLLLNERAVVVVESGNVVLGAAGILAHGKIAGRPAVELIQGRVILESLGLYRVLIACRLLIIESRYPISTSVFCEIDEVNVRVRSIYSSLGFREFTPDPNLKRISIETLPVEKRPEALGYGFSWYEVGLTERENLVALLCDSVISGSYKPLGSVSLRLEYCDRLFDMISRRAHVERSKVSDN